MNAPRLFGAIEAGGTKFACAIAREGGSLQDPVRVDTTSPRDTLDAVAAYFLDQQARYGTLDALGIASFGPLELDPAAAGYGRLLPTPKPGWSGADLVGPLRAALGCPIGLDTDVNAAALAEARLGAGRDATSVAYATIGTGIGVGLVLRGLAVHGRMHPEVGHISLRRDPRDQAFAGVCPFHGDCLEGLASGPAIAARYGRSLSELAPTHPGHDIIGGYLGQLAANLALTCSVDRIVFGGGVMGTPGLLGVIRRAAQQRLNGYLQPACYQEAIDQFIVEPGLGTLSGLTGALLLASGAADAAGRRPRASGML
jgi:fructokinase